MNYQVYNSDTQLPLVNFILLAEFLNSNARYIFGELFHGTHLVCPIIYLYTLNNIK